ncbi:MAG: ketoacid CoA transferase [Pseudomonadota bacterium]
MADYSLAELCIAACAEIFREEDEILATVIGLAPRIAGSLAKKTFAPGVMMTDGEYYLVTDPVPVGPRNGYKPKKHGVMNYERVFDVVYRGARHCLVTPVQMDRFGQMNISAIGEYQNPKVALLGARGYPGNSIHNRNSMFVPNHTPKTFVTGEVDMVSSAGYNPARYPDGRIPPFLDLRRIVTNLCVMDFGGPDHAIRVTSLHPGVELNEVEENTGFELVRAENIAETSAPTDDQLNIIRNEIDPHNLRATIFKGDPPGRPL